MTKGRRRKIALLLVFALACTLCDFNNIGIKSAFASEETVSDTTSSVQTIKLKSSEWSYGADGDCRLELGNKWCNPSHEFSDRLKQWSFTGIDISFYARRVNLSLETIEDSEAEAQLNFDSNNEDIYNFTDGGVATTTAKLTKDAYYTVSYRGDTLIQFANYMAVRIPALDKESYLQFEDVQVTLYGAVQTSYTPTPTETPDPIFHGTPNYSATQQTRGTDDDFRVGLTYVSADWKENNFTDFDTDQVMQVKGEGEYSASYTIATNSDIGLLWLDTNLYKGSRMEVDVTGVTITTPDGAYQKLYTLDNEKLRQPGSLWGYRNTYAKENYAATIKNENLRYEYYISEEYDNYRKKYVAYNFNALDGVNLLSESKITVQEGAIITVNYTVKQRDDYEESTGAPTSEPTSTPMVSPGVNPTSNPSASTDPTEKPVVHGTPNYSSTPQIRGTDDDFRVGISYASDNWHEDYFANITTSHAMQVTGEGNYEISYTTADDDGMQMLWLDTNLYKGSNMKVDVTGVSVTSADGTKTDTYNISNGKMIKPGSMWGYRDSDDIKNYAATILNPYLKYYFYINSSADNYRDEYKKYGFDSDDSINMFANDVKTLGTGSTITVSFQVKNVKEATTEPLPTPVIKPSAEPTAEPTTEPCDPTLPPTFVPSSEPANTPEVSATPIATQQPKDYIDNELWARKGIHAYIAYQMNGTWDYRNTYRTSKTDSNYNYIKAGGEEVNAADVQVRDVFLNRDGQYTIALKGVDLSASKAFNILGIATDISAKTENNRNGIYSDVKVTDASIKIDGKEIASGMNLPQKENENFYCFILKNCFGIENSGPLYVESKDEILPTPEDSIEITFTISGLKAALTDLRNGTYKDPMTGEYIQNADITQADIDASVDNSVAVPSMMPTATPTVAPTVVPTIIPTAVPAPTVAPSTEPTTVPSTAPTPTAMPAPTTAPSVEPTLVPSTEPTVAPSTEPTTVPSTTPTTGPTLVPSAEPTAVPAPTVAPSATPTIVPSITPPTMVPLPSAEPTVTPGDEPTIAPTEEPIIDPTEEPTVTPSDKPDVTPTPVPAKTPAPVKKPAAKGTTLKNKQGAYKVISSNAKKPKVAYSNVTKSKKVNVPKKVKIAGITYTVTSIAPKAFANNKKLQKVAIDSNITSIGKNAFRGCKNLKTIVIKSTKLTSSSIGSNAFKGTHKKLVIKVPKKMLKKYKKFLKKKGNKNVKVVKA
ncbi:leucine-rich repeat protein [Jutongia sp. SJQ-6]